MNPYHALFDNRAHEHHAEHLAELKNGMAVVGRERRKRRAATVADYTPQEAAQRLTAHRAARRELQAQLGAEATP